MSQAILNEIFAFNSKFPGGAESKNTDISQYSNEVNASYNSTAINLHNVIDTEVTTTVLESGTTVTSYILVSANGERVTLKSFSK